MYIVYCLHRYQSEILDVCIELCTLKVHYLGWSTKFDETINYMKQPHRIALLYTHTSKPYVNRYFSALSVDDELDVLYNNQWVSATITECNDEAVKLFIDQKQQQWYDRWDTINLARLNAHTRSITSTVHNTQSIVDRTVDSDYIQNDSNSEDDIVVDSDDSFNEVQLLCSTSDDSIDELDNNGVDISSHDSLAEFDDEVDEVIIQTKYNELPPPQSQLLPTQHQGKQNDKPGMSTPIYSILLL